MTVHEPVAAFGTEFSTPSRTASLLRARASAAGLEMRPAPDCDLVAAAIAGHLWLTALRAESFTVMPSPAAAAALAAIYCRAAGQASPREGGTAARLDALNAAVLDQQPAPLDGRQLAAVTDTACWAEHLGHPDALLDAAEDLAAGMDHPAIAAAVDALLTVVSEPLGH